MASGNLIWMSKLPAISVRDVRMSQNLSSADIPYIMRYIFVPIAWPVTVLAAALGLSPNSTTSIRFILAIIAAAMISMESQIIFVSGIALFVFQDILDSVDGNLCRVYNRASYFGKFLDGLVDIISDLIFPIAVSLHLWKHTGAEVFLVLGVVTHFALAVTIMALYRLPLFEMLAQFGEGDEGVEAGRNAHPTLNEFFGSKTINWIDSRGMNLVFDLRYLSLFICLPLGMMNIFMIVLATVYVLAMFLIVPIQVLRGYAKLDIGRKSRSARN